MMLQRWLFLPGLFYLVLVFASGTWLRLQWSVPEWTIFNPDFLTHAHSHVAVLGWAFCLLAGLLFRYAVHWQRIPATAFRVVMTALHISVIGMAVMFTWQGYGGWSIGFSTLHILAGYAVACFYFIYEREELPAVLRNFYSAAVWWLVLSTLGPWFLAFGPAMPPFWLDASIEFYLQVQFKGWLTFGLLGLALHYVHHRGFALPHISQWGFGLLLIGTLPAVIPLLDQSHVNTTMAQIGTAGSLIYAAGGLLIVASLMKLWQNSGCNLQTFLAGFAGIALVIKLIIPAVVALPAVNSAVMNYSFVIIAYLHLLLLGFISSGLLYGWLITLSGQRGRLLNGSIILYSAGAGFTLLLLLWFAATQVFGLYPWLPVQPVLFAAGLPAVAGSIGLMVIGVREYKRSVH